MSKFLPSFLPTSFTLLLLLASFSFSFSLFLCFIPFSLFSRYTHPSAESFPLLSTYSTSDSSSNPTSLYVSLVFSPCFFPFQRTSRSEERERQTESASADGAGEGHHLEEKREQRSDLQRSRSTSYAAHKSRPRVTRFHLLPPISPPNPASHNPTVRFPTSFRPLKTHL